MTLGSPLRRARPKRKPKGKLMTPRELQALLMRGAQAGAETLVDLLEEGKITSRDLAVVTGILVDKIAKLAPLAKRDDDDFTPEEFEAELARQRALDAEIERREKLAAAAKATPREGLRDESPVPTAATPPAPVAAATPSSAPVASPPPPVEVRSHRLFGDANR